MTRSGHALAVDAETGKVKWHFNTVPQDEKDQGWAIAGPTWVGGERNGGRIWETAAIDPQLGMCNSISPPGPAGEINFWGASYDPRLHLFVSNTSNTTRSERLPRRAFRPR